MLGQKKADQTAVQKVYSGWMLAGRLGGLTASKPVERLVVDLVVAKVALMADHWVAQ